MRLDIRPPSFGGDGGFDPLSPRGREVERAIEERRFNDALLIASELRTTHPDDVVIASWMAEVLSGLGRFAEAGHAWSRVVELDGDADLACPTMPVAFHKTGMIDRAVAAFEQCSVLAPDDPERWLDLANAYARSGRTTDSERALEQARRLDPEHPALVSSRWLTADGEAVP